MASYNGTALVLNWIWTGGTLGMNTDYRTFSYTPTIEMLEESAGSDAARLYIAGIKSGDLSAGGLMQAGSLPAYGSALIEGAAGTVIFYPEGTANGKYRGTIPAMCGGMNTNMAYQGLTEWAVTWTQNGARTEGTV
jgi:hypothetical protein